MVSRKLINVACIVFNVSALLQFTLSVGNEEEAIVQKILIDYSKEARPVKLANISVEVGFGLKLNTLLGLEMKNERMDTILWISLDWKDERLKWDPKKYNETTSVSLPVDKIWIPDIVLFNSAEDSLSSSTAKVKTKVTVDSLGMCRLMAPIKYKSMCFVKVKNFPYDNQKCHMVFGSWTLDKTRLRMKSLSTTPNHLSEQFSGNGQWHVRKIKTRVEEKFYSCCLHPYSQLRVTFHFERKPLYFLLYLILPCVLVSILILLVFIIPPSSGERLGLGITVILNMSVYLLVVSDNLPESSDESPLLGVFYVVMIYEMTIAFILSGLTLWISSWQTELPEIINKIFFKWPKQKNLRRIMVAKQPASKNNQIKNKSLDAQYEEDDIEKIKLSNLGRLKKTEKIQLKRTWEDVGRKLDKIFFFVFFLLFLLTSIGTVYVRPDLGSRR